MTTTLAQSALDIATGAPAPENPTLPPASAGTEHELGRLQRIGVSRVRPSPYQPRRTFDEAELQSLADDLAARGLLQPIVVRFLTGPTSWFELIAGERRLRAAQRLGWELIPAIVREMSDAEAMDACLVENIQRADLTPLEEAEAYARHLRERPTMTQQLLADLLHIPRSTVQMRLGLLAIGPWMPLHASGEISVSQAVELYKHRKHTLAIHETVIARMREYAEGQFVARIADLDVSVFRDAIGRCYGELDAALAPSLGLPMAPLPSVDDEVAQLTAQLAAARAKRDGRAAPPPAPVPDPAEPAAVEPHRDTFHSGSPTDPAYYKVPSVPPTAEVPNALGVDAATEAEEQRTAQDAVDDLARALGDGPDAPDAPEEKNDFVFDERGVSPPGECISCGCTDTTPCPGGIGCSWLAYDADRERGVCSRCASTKARAEAQLDRFVCREAIDDAKRHASDAEPVAAPSPFSPEGFDADAWQAAHDAVVARLPEQGMFTALAPLVAERVVSIKLAPGSKSDTLRVTIVPFAVGSSEHRGLSTPLSVEATPAELDAELVPAIAEYLAARESVRAGVTRATDAIAAAGGAPKATPAPAAATPAKATPKPAPKPPPKKAAKPAAKKSGKPAPARAATRAAKPAAAAPPVTADVPAEPEKDPRQLDIVDAIDAPAPPRG